MVARMDVVFARPYLGGASAWNRSCVVKFKSVHVCMKKCRCLEANNDCRYLL